MKLMCTVLIYLVFIEDVFVSLVSVLFAIRVKAGLTEARCQFVGDSTHSSL